MPVATDAPGEAGRHRLIPARGVRPRHLSPSAYLVAPCFDYGAAPHTLRDEDGMVLFGSPA